MSVTLIATPGADNANSYVDVDDADEYHDAHLYASTWNDASATQKTQGLLWATRLIDATYAFVGELASQDQALRWPRAAAFDRDGRLLANDEIPTELEQATAELARHLITADRTAPESVDLAVKRVKAGSIEVDYVNGTSKAADAVPDAVFDLIRHLVVNKSKYAPITLRRG